MGKGFKNRFKNRKTKVKEKKQMHNLERVEEKKGFKK